MEPLDRLRSVAATALGQSHPDMPVYPMSFGLMATANAFVMLGLVPESEAEEVLAAHRRALEAKGFAISWGVTDGELTVRPGAHGYWQARTERQNEPNAGPAAPVPVGTGVPPWPTPAEGYLAALAATTSHSIATGDRRTDIDLSQTAEIVATVADSLIAVGALPITSKLLHAPADSHPGWQSQLAYRWRARAQTRQLRPGPRHQQDPGLDVHLPLQHAAAVIETVAREAELVTIQMLGHPWIDGEYWPMITPCFQVRATDDSGSEHQGMLSYRSGAAKAWGRGTFFFWPPVETKCSSIRVTVSTLWEAAWTELELPPPRPHADLDPQAQDVCIMLRSHLGREHDLTVEHPDQPEDYTHTDGTTWTWKGRWHILHGVLVRSYDLAE